MDNVAGLKEEANKARQLFAVVAASQGGHKDDLDEETREIVIEGETDYREVAERAVKRLAELEALAAACKAIKADLAARQGRLEASAEAIRAALADTMLGLGVKKLELPMATLSAREGKPKLVIDAMSGIPDEFKTYELQTVEVVKKDDILAVLNEGQIVPGAHIEVKPVLTVRSR